MKKIVILLISLFMSISFLTYVYGEEENDDYETENVIEDECLDDDNLLNDDVVENSQLQSPSLSANELKEVPNDVSVYLDSNDSIVVHTDDEEFITALLHVNTSNDDYSNRSYVKSEQGRWLLPDGSYSNINKPSHTFDNYKWSDDSESIEIEEVDANTVIIDTSYSPMVNGEATIYLKASGYEYSNGYMVVYSKLNIPAPNDVTYEYDSRVLKVYSEDNQWLNQIKRLVLQDTNNYYEHCTIDDNISYHNGYVQILITNEDSFSNIILDGKDYRFIVECCYSTWTSSDDIAVFDSDVILDTINIGTGASICPVNWVFKCENNKFIIESNCNEWLDKLASQDGTGLGVIFYPSNTNTFSKTIKNTSSYQPIQRGNGCVYITDTDLKNCGIYKGAYNAIYFEEDSNYIYPEISETYFNTFQTYGWNNSFSLMYGLSKQSKPKISLSEGENGSLKIYSSNVEFLKNIMYISTNADLFNDNSSFVMYYYPDLSFLNENTLIFPNLGIANGEYSFTIYSYGFGSMQYNRDWMTNNNISFKDVVLNDVPEDINLSFEDDCFVLQTSDQDYINSLDTINSNFNLKYEYFKYCPKREIAFGAGAGSTYFFDIDNESFPSEKIDDTHYKIYSFYTSLKSDTRRKISIFVPGYDNYINVLEPNTGEKINGLDANISIETDGLKCYIYSDDIEELLSKINLDNIYGSPAYIVCGENFDDLMSWHANDDSRMGGFCTFINNFDIEIGNDAVKGDYICIDLDDGASIEEYNDNSKPFFVVFNSTYNEYYFRGLAFCINRKQYYINYHDDLLNTFMCQDDYSFYYVGNKVTLKNLYNKDYVFDGWYTKDGTGDDWGEKVTVVDGITSDIDLYAKWSPKNILSSVHSNVKDGDTLYVGDAISLFTDESDSEIHFTIDGSDPENIPNSLYTEPILLTEAGDITIKANVFKQDKTSPSSPYTIVVHVLDNQDDTIGTPEEGSASQTIGLWTSDLDNSMVYDPFVKSYTQSELRVYSDKTLLKEGSDYTVKYSKNTKAGDASLTITGKGNYSGSLTKPFTINPIEIYDGDLSITLNKDIFKYNGKIQKPVVSSVIYHNYIEENDSYEDIKLKNNIDYYVEYDNPSSIGNSSEANDYIVRIIGKGNYYTLDPIEKTYTITNKTLASTFSVSGIKNYTYTGDPVEQEGLVVKSGKTLLSEGDDYLVSYDDNNGDSTNVNAGIATLTITGINDYDGTLVKTFKIAGASISSCKVNNFESSIRYTGDEIEQSIELIKKDGMPLQEGDDYEVHYEKNIEIGNASMIIKGIGGYTGTLKKTFKITGEAFNAKTINVEDLETSVTYDNESYEQYPTLSFKNTGETLNIDDDYTISFSNNNKVGTASITFKGKGLYTGSFTVKFKINPIPLSTITFEGVDNNEEFEYVKGGAKPAVFADGLELNKDFTVKYSNNTIVNDNTNSKKITSLTITGKGNYSGTKTINFRIIPKDINDVTISAPDKVYSSKANSFKSSITLLDVDGKKLSSGSDYDKNILYLYRYDTLVLDSSTNKYVLRSENDEVGAKDIVPPGSIIKVVVKGIKNYYGEVFTTYRLTVNDVSKASVTIPVQYYTGKPIYINKDDIVVKIGSTILDNDDYIISSYSNNIEKGSATIILKGVKDYGGTKEVKFTITSKTFNNTIRFHSNGGTGTMKDQSISKNTKLTKNSYKKTGYTFLGWATSQGGGVTYGNNAEFTYIPSNSGMIIDLYAVWG